MTLRRNSGIRAAIFVLLVGLGAFGIFAAIRNTISQPLIGRDSSGETAGHEPESRGLTNVQTAATLSESARKYIWDIEQQAFRISYKAGPLVAAAMARSDRQTLLDFFSPDFDGKLLPAQTAEVIDRGLAQFTYYKSADVPANRERFVDWLVQLVGGFDSTPKVQLALLYLKPQESENMDGPWAGTWILRICGTASQGAPGETTVRGKFVVDRVAEDFADGRGWIKSWHVETAQVARATRPLMEEMSSRTGIDLARLHDNWDASRSDFHTTPGGVFASDFNSDGNVDLLVTDVGSPVLYAGRGGAKFEDVTVEAGLRLDQGQVAVACFADMDNDGDEDLLLGSAVLENRKGYFVRRGHLQMPPEATGVSVADFDRDGLADLYVACAAPPPRQSVARTSWVDDQSGVPNQLYRNTGNFRFVDVTEQAGASASHCSSFTSLWLYADDDEWPDLYVINELGNNVLLRNEGTGSFSEHHVGLEHDGFAMGASAGDVDGDGRVDLYLGNMFSKAGLRIIANIPSNEYPPALIEKMQSFVAGNTLLLNRPGSGSGPGVKFEPLASSSVSAVGWAYGTAMVDLDGDGLLDLYGTAGFASFSRTEPDG